MWHWDMGPLRAPPDGMFLFMVGGWQIVIGCQDRWLAAMDAARAYSSENVRAVESPVKMLMLESNGQAQMVAVEYLGHGKPKPIALSKP